MLVLSSIWQVEVWLHSVQHVSFLHSLNLVFCVHVEACESILSKSFLAVSYCKVTRIRAEKSEQVRVSLRLSL